MSKQKTVLAVLREAVHCDQISRKKNGNYIFRSGYFYRSGTPEGFAERIKKALATTELQYTVVDIGDQWTPFRGGAPVAKQSHYYVEMQIVLDNTAD